MASERTVTQFLASVVCPKMPSLEGPESISATKHIVQLRNVIKKSKNVIAIGAALKVRSKKTLQKFSLTFFVTKKVSTSRLVAAEAVPPVVLTSVGESIQTDVVEIGKIVPEVNIRRKSIAPGYSIGHFRQETGTLGAIVARSGDLFVLSNSHVLAMSGAAKKGDPILYPGIHDHGKKKTDTVARLTKFVKLKARGNNSVDAAIAKIDHDRLGHVEARIKKIGFVKGTTVAKVGMKVEKVGRTTGRTTGRVLSRTFRLLRVPYIGIGEVSFSNPLILISRFTKPGDSGSLVIDSSNKKAIGLHFAGAKGGSVSVPIDEVLRAMDVNLVTNPPR